MPVSYEELQNSPVESLELTGFSATRSLKCAWEDRKTLMDELLRQEYPVIAVPYVICSRVSCVPMPGKQTGSGSTASYEFALVTAEYTRPQGQEQDETGTRISESIEPTAEFLTVGVKNLRWGAADGDPVEKEEAPGKLFVGFDYVLSKENLSALPANLLELVGKVNSVAVSPTSQGLEGWVFQAETLLYNPPSIARVYDEDGNPLWNITYRLTYKPNWDMTQTPPVARGWNWFWRIDPDDGEGKFEAMYGIGGPQYKQYPPGDFTQL